MHASSIVALAFGATAASAAAVPDIEVRAVQACDPYCQFPESIDCPVRNGVHVLKKDLVEAARNGNREGEPREKDASNLATKHCSDQKFRGIPLWITEIPEGPAASAGSLYYALASNGTFYFCSTSSGQAASGWPNTCTENK